MNVSAWYELRGPDARVSRGDILNRMECRLWRLSKDRSAPRAWMYGDWASG